MEITSNTFHISEAVIAIDSHGKIIALNDSVEKMTGFKEDEFLLKKIEDVFISDQDKKIIHGAIQQNNSFNNISLELLCANQATISVTASLTPLEQAENGIVGAIIVFHDSSEINLLYNDLKQKTNELNYKSSLLETVLNCHQEGIFSIDKNWEITTFNQKAVELTGYPANEVLGKKCWEIFKTKNCHNHCHMSDTLHSQTASNPSELFITNIENKKIPVRVNTSPLYDKEHIQIGALETIQDLSELVNLSSHLEKQYQFKNLVGKSKAMEHVYNMIENVIQNDSTVLISGESGTGKETIARSIHLHSERKSQPFYVIGCNTFSDILFVSDLFGHEKGSFEAAYISKPGKFELANNGTILLDGIDELSLPLQLKLAKALELKQFERIGGLTHFPLNARIMATTTKDLHNEVKEKRFSEELFYRLSVVNVSLPLLQDRMDDLPLLINFILCNLSKNLNRQSKSISPRTFKFLKNYNWPGNIRELENVLEHAFIISNSDVIEPEHLPERLWELLNKPSAKKDEDEEITLKSAEKLILINNLRKFKGHRGKTAKALGIDRTSLWRKMKKYNLLN